MPGHLTPQREASPTALGRKSGLAVPAQEKSTVKVSCNYRVGFAERVTPSARLAGTGEETHCSTCHISEGQNQEPLGEGLIVEDGLLWERGGRTATLPSPRGRPTTVTGWQEAHYRVMDRGTARCRSRRSLGSGSSGRLCVVF